jgi:hypothetical protein
LRHVVKCKLLMIKSMGIKLVRGSRHKWEVATKSLEVEPLFMNRFVVIHFIYFFTNFQSFLFLYRKKKIFGRKHPCEEAGNFIPSFITFISVSFSFLSPNWRRKRDRNKTTCVLGCCIVEEDGSNIQQGWNLLVQPKSQQSA